MKSLKITRLDIVISVGAALCCLLLFIPNWAVWATFIGITWYFVAGATAKAFKEVIPPMLLAYILGTITCLLFNLSGGNVWVCCAMIGITVMIIMIFAHHDLFAFSTASFNAYSCLFAGYYLGAYPVLANGGPGDFYNILVSAGWMVLCNVVGIIVGYFMIKLGVPADKSNGDS